MYIQILIGIKISEIKIFDSVSIRLTTLCHLNTEHLSAGEISGKN